MHLPISFAAILRLVEVAEEKSHLFNNEPYYKFLIANLSQAFDAAICFFIFPILRSICSHPLYSSQVPNPNHETFIANKLHCQQ